MESTRGVVVGANIKSAPIDLLERLSVHHSAVQRTALDVKRACGAGGVVVLSTCNRFEIYATCPDGLDAAEGIRRYLVERCAGGSEEARARLLGALYSYADEAAYRHLFEVVSGLDSLIVGEAEILGQVSRAYQASCEAKATDKLCNAWFQRALHLGKRARSQTLLGSFSVSVGRIAVDLAVREFGDVHDKRALVLGAGEMSELTAKYLAAHKFPVVMVANRSLARARELACAHGFTAHPLDEVESCLAKADVVFSATSAKTCLVTEDMVRRVMAARPARPLLLVDMAIPRDVEPAVANLPGVSLHNINELRDAAERGLFERMQAAAGARALIDEELADFTRWISALELVPVIAALRRYADGVKAERLEAAADKLKGLSSSQRHAVDVLATTIVDQIVRGPVEALNARAGTPRARECAGVLQELFGFPPEVLPDGTAAACWEGGAARQESEAARKGSEVVR
ncbi:glutamyl-tRNA reductase [Adlercreutzia sp. ZJ242]|uniref:glutamyl-tRNA reductase n=1 Tax=Adlercreutzia sp. ZJ242 TaxID=2709409 RepID=UPI0013ECC2A3|nr:glutamyl-tRNA reductase [Adlercreutzia sp. ZJ242]